MSLSKSSDDPVFIPDFGMSLPPDSSNNIHFNLSWPVSPEVSQFSALENSPAFIHDFVMPVPPDISNYVHPNVSWPVSPKSSSPKPTDRLVPVLVGMTLWWFLDRSTSTHQCNSDNPKLSLSGNHKVPQFDMPELSMPDSCGIHSLPFDFPNIISSNSIKCLSSGIPDSSSRTPVRSLTGIADTFSSDRSTYECSTSITHNIASLTFSCMQRFSCSKMLSFGNHVTLEVHHLSISPFDGFRLDVIETLPYVTPPGILVCWKFDIRVPPDDIRYSDSQIISRFIYILKSGHLMELWESVLVCLCPLYQVSSYGTQVDLSACSSDDTHLSSCSPPGHHDAERSKTKSTCWESNQLAWDFSRLPQAGFIGTEAGGNSNAVPITGRDKIISADGVRQQ